MNGFFYAVIEGFYGRQWSWQARSDYAAFLSAQGFDAYIYAPKADAYLRGQWQQPWPTQLHGQLKELSDVYHQAGLRFGVGLSPQGLFEDYSPASREALRQKVEAINEVGADLLCILFDDMPGDFPQLAARQLQIVEDVMAVSAARQHIVCPTYYSFDPVLEQVFGPMPGNYLVDLGRGLAPEVDIFWTGNKVISDSYSKADIDRASSALGRTPVLWDNYPVNDGRLTSSHLHLRPYSGRPGGLRNWAKGHCVNPMNQPGLSRLPLMSLGELYGEQVVFDPVQSRRRALGTLGSPGLADALLADGDFFQDRGLSGLTRSQRDEYIARYRLFDHPLACEVVDWLEGGYEFDPACLTE